MLFELTVTKKKLVLVISEIDGWKFEKYLRFLKLGIPRPLAASKSWPSHKGRI